MKDVPQNQGQQARKYIKKLQLKKPKIKDNSAKLYKKISEKKPQDQRQQAQKYTMKLKPQGSENKEVILYNINRQKEKKLVKL